MTFTTKDESQAATATMEQANVPNEQGEFIYYNEAVKVYSKIFDHTNNGQGDADGYAIRLTGGNTDKMYGLAKSLSVMPGDTIKMDVFAKYVTGTPSSNTWAGTLLSTMTAISANALGVVVDGGLAGSIGGQSFPMEGYMTRSAENETAPKAYLNWLVFNRQDSLVDFGYIRLTTAALENGSNGAHEHLEKGDLLIREPGYVYIYLSNENENPVEVFFDDFKVEHIKSPIVQTDDYYPFGFAFNSHRRENSIENRYLYNGKELQHDLGLGWYDYIARQYDPITGRFLSVDPAADLMRRFSTYAYSFDNPIRFIDPDGMIPEQATGGDQEDPKKKNQQEQQQTKTWDDLGPLEKFFGTLILLTEELGSRINQGQGKESGDFDDNIQTGINTINDVVLTVQGTHEILTSGPASGKNLADDAASNGAKLLNKADDAANAAIKTTDDIVKVRHHTSSAGLKGIKKDGQINPARGKPPGVDVEMEPFSRPSQVNLGQAGGGNKGGGGYVEFSVQKSDIVVRPGTEGEEL
ncbi:RHS repeat-associated core domain-containing protein [Fulvivirgaceae bacterium PWU4]|uniref:RHS repeat-associated core domain-containing protein n=1 Tax=Chryseosolibacter histidini TaxID=2782349 RepID=A0AAP2DMS7_9BACT|nr:RHS repeat-associated core domain-containing protein [Chryseosolibacter histidini]MBT1699241.1 RHS repeat-associated core domain-containing protein [Chryseosolibacter histidini]